MPIGLIRTSVELLWSPLGQNDPIRNRNSLQWHPTRAFAAGPVPVGRTIYYGLNRIYNKMLDCDWFSARLFIMVIGLSGVQLRL